MNTYLVWSMANQYFVIKMTTTSSEAPKVYIEETKGKTTNKCIHCDFASARADNLRSHLLIHSGEKAHTCSQCDFASALIQPAV